VWIALVVAGGMLMFAASGAGPLPGDLVLTRLLQGLPPDGPAGLLLSYVDDAVWFLAVLALAVALLWRRWADALFIFLASVTGMLVGDALKLLAARPRPPVELTRVYEPSDGYGFPSGTVLFAVVLLGAVCYLVRSAPRPAFVAVLTASSSLVVGVGLSRVYVGEHWATDVLGGWLFGSAWLVLLVAVHRRWFTGSG
jgi:undecaprenyl-diphosphatase